MPRKSPNCSFKVAIKKVWSTLKIYMFCFQTNSEVFFQPVKNNLSISQDQPLHAIMGPVLKMSSAKRSTIPNLFLTRTSHKPACFASPFCNLTKFASVSPIWWLTQAVLSCREATMRLSRREKASWGRDLVRLNKAWWRLNKGRIPRLCRRIRDFRKWWGVHYTRFGMAAINQ